MKRSPKKQTLLTLNLETKKIDSGRHSCTRTGGRVPSFSCFFLAGNKNPQNPMIGVARGKAKTSTGSKAKALRKSASSCSYMYFPYDSKKETLKHPIKGKQGATSVVILPGSGLCVPDCARAFFELIGLSNVSMKVFGPSNKRNILSAIQNAFARSEFYS